MIWVRSIIFDIWLWVWMGIWGILFSPLALLSKDGAYWVMRSYAKTVLWVLRVLCGLGYEIRGEVPDYPVLIASKHQSFIDSLILFIHFKRAKFVMRSNLKWAPIFGWYAMRIGTTPVRRGKGGAAVKDMTAKLSEEREESGTILIYPQGTRVSPEDTDTPYKFGAWKLYQNFDLPCVPVALNTGVFWGRKTLIRKPGTMVVEFLEPIPTGMDAEPFMDLVKGRVEAASMRLAAESQARTSKT